MSQRKGLERFVCYTWPGRYTHGHSICKEDEGEAQEPTSGANTAGPVLHRKFLQSLTNIHTELAAGTYNLIAPCEARLASDCSVLLTTEWKVVPREQPYLWKCKKSELALPGLESLYLLPAKQSQWAMEARLAASKARAEPSSSLPILDSGVRNLRLKVNTSYEGGGAQMWFSN